MSIFSTPDSAVALERRHRKKHHSDGESEDSGSFKITNGTGDKRKEGKISSQDEKDALGEQLKKIQLDIEMFDDHKRQLEELYNMGARKIAVVGLPPLGCIPSQRTLAGGIQRDCVPHYNQASAVYNEELIKSLQQLQQNLPLIRINYVDIYQRLLDLIQRHLHYGFDESTKGCCGTGLLEASILCNSISSTTCVDDSRYVFWDSFHPSEKAYEILTRKIVQEDLPYFF